MSKPTILTLDDDPMVSAGIARDLGRRYRAECRVVGARSGAHALVVPTKLAPCNQPMALLGDWRQANPDHTYDVRVVERDAEAQRLKLTGSDLTQRAAGETMPVHLVHRYPATI